MERLRYIAYGTKITTQNVNCSSCSWLRRCPVCSKDPREIEFIDYEQFCAMPSRAVARPEEAVA